jgi:putative Mn2+ efflux pump MntP
MNGSAQQAFEQASRIAFAIIAGILALLAVGMTVYGVGQSLHALYLWEDFGSALLRGVGYIIIAIAVFEVAKYLVEEELVHEREMRSAAEARRSLTKFVSTIAIAVFLEGLVTVFRVSQENVQDLIYPALLLITAVVMILGLGAFQRLSATVEQKVGADDARENAAASKKRR